MGGPFRVVRAVFLHSKQTCTLSYFFVPIKAGPRYSANGFIEKAGRSTKGTLANVIVSSPCLWSYLVLPIHSGTTCHVGGPCMRAVRRARQAEVFRLQSCMVLQLHVPKGCVEGGAQIQVPSGGA